MRPRRPADEFGFTAAHYRALGWVAGLDRHLAGACAAIGATALMLIAAPALAMVFAGARP